jgi:hypothetical protein
MDAKKTSELILVCVEQHLQLFVKSLLGLDKSLFEREQSISIINEAVTELLFLVDELDHFDEKVFFL